MHTLYQLHDIELSLLSQNLEVCQTAFWVWLHQGRPAIFNMLKQAKVDGSDDIIIWYLKLLQQQLMAL